MESRHLIFKNPKIKPWNFVKQPTKSINLDYIPAQFNPIIKDQPIAQPLPTIQIEVALTSNHDPNLNATSNYNPEPDLIISNLESDNDAPAELHIDFESDFDRLLKYFNK